MEEIRNMLRNVDVSAFEKKSEYWVHITHINDPHHFYARLTQHAGIVQKIETLKPVSKPSCLNINDIILFNLTEKCDIPKFARGEIRRVVDNGETPKFDIFVLDYGYFVKDVSSECIWECDDSLLNIPPLAIQCLLGNCAPKGGKDWGEAIDAFKYFVGNDRVTMVILEHTNSPRNLIVKIYIRNPADDIATMLALTDFTTLGYIHNDLNLLYSPSPEKSTYKFKELKANSSLHVRVLSGTTLKSFYVADVYDYKKYLDECINFAYFSKKSPVVEEGSMKKGDLVCTKDFPNYNRGIITEVKDNKKALVHLIDLGKVEECTTMNMRKAPRQCLEMPAIAIFCSAEEDQVWDNGLHRFLYPGFQFIIDIKGLGHQFESPNIVNVRPLKQSPRRKLKKETLRLSKVQ